MTREGEGAGDWGGRVLTVQLKGTKDGSPTSVTISGATFRSLYGLRSTYFTFTP
jgi:stage II sporulation protein D